MCSQLTEMAMRLVAAGRGDYHAAGITILQGNDTSAADAHGGHVVIRIRKVKVGPGAGSNIVRAYIDRAGGHIGVGADHQAVVINSIKIRPLSSWKLKRGYLPVLVHEASRAGGADGDSCVAKRGKHEPIPASLVIERGEGSAFVEEASLWAGPVVAGQRSGQRVHAAVNRAASSGVVREGSQDLAARLQRVHRWTRREGYEERAVVGDSVKVRLRVGSTLAGRVDHPGSRSVDVVNDSDYNTRAIHGAGKGREVVAAQNSLERVVLRRQREAERQGQDSDRDDGYRFMWELAMG